MNGQRKIILPIGTKVNGTASTSGVMVFESDIRGLSVDTTGSLVLLTTVVNSNATVYSVNCGNLANASSFIDAVNNFLASGSSTPVFQPQSGSAISALGLFTVQTTQVPALSGFSPDPFALLTDTVTFTGAGFSNATLGKIYVENLDPGGSIAASMDDNGYWMQPTFVSATSLTAVLGGSGDGILPAGVACVYYRDTNGVASNVLLCETNGTPAFGVLQIMP